MSGQDALQLKEKIIFTIKRKGPSLPVHIAKETGQSMLFASAFLAELLSEKKIKISNLKVGASPIYFIDGQEPLLERYSQHLKSKEKDAHLLLKEKKFLDDETQDPAIRVALRAIKDFAIPFQKENKIFWRYFTIPESEFELKKGPIEQIQKIPLPAIPEKIEPIIQRENFSVKEEKPKLNIFDEKPKEKPIKIKKSKQIKKKSSSSTKQENFFNSVKEYLSKNQIEILDILGFNKNDLMLKIKKQEKELLLIAHNKKKIDDKDIINSHKKAIELNLPYSLLSLGEPTKKITTLIEAIKALDSLENFE